MFDLLALGKYQEALNNCLAQCLSSPDVLKVRVKVEEALLALYENYPAVSAFKTVTGGVDLRWVIL